MEPKSPKLRSAILMVRLHFKRPIQIAIEMVCIELCDSVHTVQRHIYQYRPPLGSVPIFFICVGFCIDHCQCNGLITLPVSDIGIDLDSDSCTMQKLGVGIRVPSLCNVNMFCIVKCSHRAWNLNPSPYPCIRVR